MHTNPETLALLALGEDVATVDERQHVVACPDCSHELLELERLTDLGRTAGEESGLTRPSPQVWDQVRAELGFTGDPLLAPSPLPVGPIMTRTVSPNGPEPAGHRDDDSTVVPIKPRQERRSRSIRLMAVAAALALVAGVGIGLGIERLRQPSETVVATGELVAFPDWAGSGGTAVVEKDGNGKRTLVVKLTTSRPGDDLTVWLMDPSNGKLKTMGSIVGGFGRYEIAPGLSLKDFPAVDVSDEPLNDGNPAHSGNTVVRGNLKL